ncbi:hypothetical protein CBS101457_006629 [Exobasidium rhododendri]|nr:hypothetical protein CBS101457_006629 [Exobasidium rhododendri]
MAQGFKPSKAGSSKSSVRKEKSGPKRGPKVIAPRKRNAIQEAGQKRKQTASLVKQIEADMAGRASGGGPLTIMKDVGDKANKERQAEKERKAAKKAEKGRA